MPSHMFVLGQLSGQIQEQFVHVLSALGRCFHEEQPALLGVLGRLRPLNYPLLRQVPLVAHQHDLGQDTTSFP